MKRPKQQPELREVDALVIADELVDRNAHHPVVYDGSRYEGGPDAKWIFFYRIQMQAGVVDPSHVIVVVDVLTKEATFFPTM